MALHILIDGYNLIHSGTLSILEWISDLQAQRETLVEKLKEYNRRKHHPITVVFDGTHAPVAMQRKDRSGGVVIRFSRPGQTADALIKNLVEQERERALVVTSDRDIVRFAESRGATVLSSFEFGKRLSQTEIRPKDFLNGESEVPEASWIPTTKKKGPRKRASKKERRALYKAEKL